MQNSYKNLIKKYNVPAPRYTSYPTVPFWSNEINETSWNQAVQLAYERFGEEEGISLYIHLPYCESLCTYCGCNKHITINHGVEIPYISAMIKEWGKYLDMLPANPKLSSIHLGGGTPTFFSPAALQMLIRHITRDVQVMPSAEFSFEGHPNNTTREHLEALYEVGFRRVSFGIQDFDINVQKAIHRIQPFEKVASATETAREIGYRSINFDLIYGLPHQTVQSICSTFEQVDSLKPDRIAFYSYAHVPQAFPAQKSFEKFLPQENEKRDLYETGKAMLQKMGYEEVGMDHFALPEDPLFLAKTNKTLHRNFMGYTTLPSKILIGLGSSSISDVYFAYAQNEKLVEDYKSQVSNGEPTIVKGHILTEEDTKIKALILNLICKQEAAWPEGYSPFKQTHWLQPLIEFKQEGLLDFDSQGICIFDPGVAFIRNICMTFDTYLQSAHNNPGFSKAI